MKLIVQIPCYNEEKTLAKVISEIPRNIDGIENVEVLVINDGSEDRTVEVAKESGADYILENMRNMGLSLAFVKGFETCLYLSADIIVNIDGDNQYKGEDIKSLVKTLLDKNADLVIGCRDLNKHPEFSPLKKFFQKLGRIVVNKIGGLDLADVTTGFRAYSRMAAIKTTVFNSFSYTVETLIQAGSQGMRVLWIPIDVNSKTRNSRLFRSNFHYIRVQSIVILKSVLIYRPIFFFFTLGIFSMIVAIIFGIRFSYYLWFVDPSQVVFKMGSGILLQFSVIVSVICFLGGFLGMLLSGLRSLIEDIHFSKKRQILNSNNILPHIELLLWRARKNEK